VFVSKIQLIKNNNNQLNHFSMKKLSFKLSISTLGVVLLALVMMSSSCKKPFCEENPTDPTCKDTVPTPPNPVKTYNIGDLYNVNGVKGVVYKITDGGKHGWIVSIDDVNTQQYLWSDLMSSITGTTDENDGTVNMATIKTISGWETHYPAFKYWDEKGWYIPAINELVEIWNNYAVISSQISTNGGQLVHPDETIQHLFSRKFLPVK
jgi:hypothetical protein